jgi:hypothetical protein
LITRIHGKVWLECDRCHEILDTETKEISEAQALWNTEGWSSRLLAAGGWHHYCPKCK